MYPVSTHWIVEIDAPNSSPSVGIATFTIVTSRIVMIVPSTTTAPRTRISLSSPPCSGVVRLSTSAIATSFFVLRVL